MRMYELLQDVLCGREGGREGGEQQKQNNSRATGLQNPRPDV